MNTIFKYFLMSLIFIACVGCLPAKPADEDIYICVPQHLDGSDFIEFIESFAAANSFKVIDDSANKEAEMKASSVTVQDILAHEAPPVWIYIKSKRRGKVPFLASNFGEKENVIGASFFYYERQNLGADFAKYLKSELRKQGYMIVTDASECKL